VLLKGKEANVEGPEEYETWMSIATPGKAIG
jgi:hypothetical protein